MSNSEKFLASFSSIEKWLRNSTRQIALQNVPNLLIASQHKIMPQHIYINKREINTALF